MDSTIRPLYLCLSIIWSYVVCEATYTASQEVDCDPSSNLPCSTDVKYQDLTYGVTEDIEIALKFRFTGQTCQNPKISMQFVQQDFESSNEYLKVYDGAATTDPELAQCGTMDGYGTGDCGYYDCLDAKALGNTNMVDEVNILIYVSLSVDGYSRCPGNYKLDAKLSLSCDGNTGGGAGGDGNEATITPSVDASQTTSEEPSVEPTVSPSREPTNGPTPEPSEEPSVEPTVSPSREPTNGPTPEPSDPPIQPPSQPPTVEPIAVSTNKPADDPSMSPRDPTVDPNEDLSGPPAVRPLRGSTNEPTTDPKASPDVAAGDGPTDGLNAPPSASPTKAISSLSRDQSTNTASSTLSNISAQTLIIVGFVISVLLVMISTALLKYGCCGLEQRGPYAQYDAVARDDID